MDFSQAPNETEWRDRVRAFMDQHVRPRAPDYEAQQRGGERWKVLPVVEELKEKARAEGLWNLFMPPSHGATPVDDSFKFEGPGLSNLEYAFCAEEMGRILWSSEVFNCSAPDTGNMEVINRYGTREQKDEWLKPLMDGEIRSAFLMTEPDVASSDATNIQCSIEMRGNEYVINGRKWWSSGAGDPRCKVAILMGKTDPSAEKHQQQSMILMPLDAPGVTIKRHLPVFGYDDAPHGHMEIVLEDVRVPPSNMLLGEGRGFEIAQGRLGPGRIHHCMRTIGAAEEALDAMVKRLMSRVAFGKTIAEQGVWEERVANARIDIEMTRLLCLKAADMMDRAGNKARAGRNCDDQGRRADHGVEDHRRRDLGFRGSGRVRGCGTSADLFPDPDAAARGWAGRSASPRHRQAGVQEASMSEQQLDVELLGRWLEANVEGFQGPFELTKFPSGQSNPTYRIRAASGDYVMRRKPFGKLLPSAHAVDREYRLLSAPASARLPRSTAAGPVRRSRGHQRHLLRDGDGEGAALREWRSPGLRPSDAPANVRAIDRYAGRPARHRP